MPPGFPGGTCTLQKIRSLSLFAISAVGGFDPFLRGRRNKAGFDGSRFFGRGLQTAPVVQLRHRIIGTAIVGIAVLFVIITSLWRFLITTLWRFLVFKPGTA